MKFFNVIFAAFLSLLVALPLCCCSARAGNVKAAEGCCQTKQESGGSQQDTKLCACESHDAKDKSETARLPRDGATDINIPDFKLTFAPVSLDMMAAFTERFRIIDDPLGNVFARYSRWII